MKDNIDDHAFFNLRLHAHINFPGILSQIDKIPQKL